MTNKELAASLDECAKCPFLEYYEKARLMEAAQRLRESVNTGKLAEIQKDVAIALCAAYSIDVGTSEDTRIALTEVLQKLASASKTLQEMTAQ